jgi:hypothetical protein
MTPKQLNIFAYSLSALAALVAIVGWGGGYKWQLADLSLYQIFPLLGLLAFGIMWSHYISSVARLLSGHERAALKTYFQITSLVVLVAIILHPGLLITQLYLDGAGVNYYQYVPPRLYWALWLSSTSFFVFLAYELHRWYEDRSWWRFVAYASDAAMIAVFIHALTLGQHLHTGWLRYVWWFYGVTLGLSLIYIYARRWKRHFA